MFIFPFQVDFRLVRIPFVTMFVMLLCVGVYLAQSKSTARWADARDFACAHADENLRWIWNRDGNGAAHDRCEAMLVEIAAAPDSTRQIGEITDDVAARPDSRQIGGREAVLRSLTALWSNAQRLGGRPPLTPRLAYDPHTWNPWRMVTAALAHASWGHLLGNLFFFYLFAATIEGVLGGWRFAGFLLLLALGTHAIYSIVSVGAFAPPTIGLSGVVYGVMGLFAYFLPDARIRSVVWLVIRVSIARLSAWFVALWYIGGDAFSLFLHGNHGGTNLVAHVSGAVLALTLGTTLFRRDRDWVREEAKPYLQRYD